MRLFISLLVSLCAACSAPSIPKVALADQLIDYQVLDNQYIVVVVEEGISSAKARQMALQRAAELTVESGKRYFTIDSEERVQVVKSDANWPNTEAFHQNMYQELIVEKNFCKECLENQTGGGAALVPAIRIHVTCYSDKPFKKSYEACKYTHCSK